MKKPMSIVAVIGLAIAAAFGILLFTNRGEQQQDALSQTDNSEAGSTTQNTIDEPRQSSQLNGKYIDYTPDAIQNTDGTKILYFHANWCPQCRALEADIRDQGVPDGVTVMKVDFDNSQDLREKYGVTLQTTLVKVDDDGNLLQKFVAYQDPSVESLQENLL